MQQSLWGSEHPSDPRKDLITDHRHWKDILWNCWHSERELYYLLHGIRCGGAEIILSQRGYRLISGEWSEAEWEDIKQNRLNQFKDKLIEVFKLSRFGLVSNEKLPDGTFESKK
jgi:hypothetical protein